MPDHDFWIFACRFNIATETKTQEDIDTAISAAEEIISGRVVVPERYVQGARQFLSKLRAMEG
jgi:hypothetical protein